MSSNELPDDDREEEKDSPEEGSAFAADPGEANAESQPDSDEDELGDVVEPDDEEQPPVRVSLKKRLIALCTPTKLGVSIAVVAIVGLAWWATRPIEPVKPPEKPPEPEELYAQQIEQVLSGASTQLHTTTYEIDNEKLLLIPLEELEKAAEQRRLNLLADEQASDDDEATDESSSDSAPLPPGSSLSSSEEESGEPQVSELPKLDTVLIDEGVITDEGIATIAKIPELRHLRLRLSPITDEGLKPLLERKSIWFLNLPHSRLTEKGIRSLSALPKLRQLRVGSTLLGNDIGRALLEVKSLRGLHLIGVPLSDEGLKVIVQLPHLESLYLDDAAITESGWDWLFQNHPQLHVHINQRHHDRDPQHHKHE
ncbi:leucine-rich repeat domain-containing protein [Rhodopirellula europaea]|uniref:Adenylate cyclase regulatory protein n=1 Tax=Rhodopirellula europaea 6C TaxID=1263867 RepID=M2AMJ5_9BACT|nr:adenylate cyclase [Rhodopirellula europaea]EMB13932.1 adenylate cyclase regulatory protein [Rhodopirellula europaea 6C]